MGESCMAFCDPTTNLVCPSGYSLHDADSTSITANLVLEDTVERIYHENLFAESWHGLFLIRGENVVLLGEIDLDREDDIPLRQVEYHELEPFHKSAIELKKQNDDAKSHILYKQKGFCKEGGEGDGY
ncbi:hypothetical protein HHX47_DHR1001955 [Lentinula edodes]|nr:hypothetical protein HHX47_DHR1001955 [Lentinula edodes]